MWTTVDIQDQWILLVRIKIRWFLYPCLDLFAVEALIPDLFRPSEIYAREQIVIEMCELFRFAAPALKPEKIANPCRGGKRVDKTPGVGRTESNHSLIAASDVGKLTGRNIKRGEVCFSFFGINFDDAASISRPYRRIAATTARRRVISTHARANVVIKTRREIARLCIRSN